MGAKKTSDQDLDIVCGRGKGYDALPGNRSFKQIIQDHAGEYSELSRADKSKVVRRISKHLAERNMRFVKPQKKGKLVLLPKRDVNIKIGHALRDVQAIRRKQERNQKKRSAASKHNGDRMDSGDDDGMESSGSSQSACPSPSFSPIPISSIPHLGKPPSDLDLAPAAVPKDPSTGVGVAVWPFSLTELRNDAGVDLIRDNDDDPADQKPRAQADLDPLDIATETQWNDSLSVTDADDILHSICGV